MEREQAFFRTPEKWLAEHIAKNGPDGIFPGTNNVTFKRAKK